MIKLTNMAQRAFSDLCPKVILCFPFSYDAIGCSFSVSTTRWLCFEMQLLKSQQKPGEWCKRQETVAQMHGGKWRVYACVLLDSECEWALWWSKCACRRKVLSQRKKQWTENRLKASRVLANTKEPHCKENPLHYSAGITCIMVWRRKVKCLELDHDSPSETQKSTQFFAWLIISTFTYVTRGGGAGS